MAKNSKQDLLLKVQTPRLNGAGSTVEGEALGTATKLPTKKDEIFDSQTGEIARIGELSQQERILQARRIRYELQDVSAKILYNFYGSETPKNEKGYPIYHRTCGCNKLILSDTVSIKKAVEYNKSFYSGTMQCGSAAVCPVCAAPINERKANEMRVMANQVIADDNLNLSLLTFTAPHKAGQTLESIGDAISKTLIDFWSGRWATDFKKQYGIKGNVRSFEINYGSNGFHPHFHILIVSENSLPHTVRTLKGSPASISKQQKEWRSVLERWQALAQKNGLDMPNEYGLDIQSGEKAGEYITKFGSDGEVLKTKDGKDLSWDMADEMTKGVSKQGRKSSRTMFQLLADSADESYSLRSRKNFEARFLEYARFIKGKSLLKWSRGLRSMFGLSATEKTDVEILAERENTADTLAVLSVEQWRYIIKNNHRALVLELAENGGTSAVWGYLQSHGFAQSIIDFTLEREKSFDTSIDVELELDVHLSERKGISKIRSVLDVGAAAPVAKKKPKSANGDNNYHGSKMK